MRSLRIIKVVFLFILMAAPLVAQTAPSAQAPSVPDSTKLEILEHSFSYPAEAREKGIEGQVIVRVSVAENGTVTDVQGVSGDPILLRAAVEAAKQWTFKPYIKNGKAVPVSANLPVNFHLSPQDRHDENTALPAGPIKIPSGIAQGHLIHTVAPVYPFIARQAHVSGAVRLSASIDKDGKVTNIKAISGPPLLINAAIDSVKQWRYRPYLQNGQPVEVQTEITVIFTLGG